MVVEVTIFTKQTSALFILLMSEKSIHQPESFKTAVSIQKSFLGIILGAQTSRRLDEMPLSFGKKCPCVSKHGMGPFFTGPGILINGSEGLFKEQ